MARPIRHKVLLTVVPAWIGLVVFGCSDQSARLEGNARSEQNLAKLEADLAAKLDAKLEAMVALANDRSSDQIQTSGPVSTERRTLSPDFSAFTGAIVEALGKFQVGAGTKETQTSQSVGRGLAETKTQSQDGMVNYAYAGVGSIGLVVILGFSCRALIKLGQQQTDRLRIVMDGSIRLAKHHVEIEAAGLPEHRPPADDPFDRGAEP